MEIAAALLLGELVRTLDIASNTAVLMSADHDQIESNLRLHVDRLAGLIDPRTLKRPKTISLRDILCIHAFAANDTRSELFAEQAKRMIRVLLHRSERDRVCDGGVSDLHDCQLVVENTLISPAETNLFRLPHKRQRSE
jgi:hypothetical protein